MKVLVCGGRTFSNKPLVWATLNNLNVSQKIDLLIEGGANGADSLARAWAKESGVPIQTCPADWAKYGRAAGHIRNKQMLDQWSPDLVIAFPGGKGTENMVAQATKRNVRVVRVQEV